jgi:hypothetical protein
MDEPIRFVTIEYFIHDMLGYKSRISYYNHINDKGWPQRVYPTEGKPKLIYAECVAYQQKIMKARSTKKRPTDGVKRRVGRPMKPRASAVESTEELKPENPGAPNAS